MTSLLEKSFKANGWEVTEVQGVGKAGWEKGTGERRCKVGVIDGRTAILISKSIGALKEKNKDERECEGGLSAGAFRDPRVRCLFLAGGGGKWASTSGSLFLLSLNGKRNIFSLLDADKF